MKNFAEIDFSKFGKKIEKSLEEYNINKEEAITLAFYNSLIINQKENYDVRQNELFSGIYIINL